MNTSDILSLLKSDPMVKQIFLGVFPSDQLPPVLTTPSALVVNLDKQNEPGSHWVALYFDSKSKCEYFDSYGREPHELEQYILKNADSYTYNTKPLQNLISSTCGQFCIYFLVWRVRNVPLKSILTSLEKQYADEFVTGFVNKLFKTRTVVYDENYIVQQLCRAMFENL